MVSVTCVFVILLITFIICLQVNLSDKNMDDEWKLRNIQKINTTLTIVVLCYICLFIGKVIL